MSGTDISRRTFMAGAATAALSAGVLSGEDMPELASDTRPSGPGVGPFDKPGNPSRKAYRAYAESEYEHYKRMRERYEQQDGGNGDGPGKPTKPNFSRTVDAVEEFGVDPNGGRPIEEDIDSVPEDTLVVFPAGNFKIASRLILEANKAGFVGAGYKQDGPPSGDGKTTKFITPPNTYAAVDCRFQTGMLGSFVFDFNASKSILMLNARSKGFVQYKDIVWDGIVDTVGSQAHDDKEGDYLCAMQPNPGATSRATRFVMKNVGIPGTKNIGGRNGFWCGVTNEGVAQIESCTISATADNGVYGGRTPGDVQIKGGLWKNNEVCHNRFSGKGSFSDGATMIHDAASYEGPVGDYGVFNEKIGTHAVKIERGDVGITKPAGAVLRNAEIRMLQPGPHGFGSGIRVRGSGSALKVENCRFTNESECITIVAEPPGGGYSGFRGPAPYNVTLTDSLIQGTEREDIIKVNGRENSLIRNTCIKVPGAGRDTIEGMQIGSNVKFGKKCGSAGLQNPDKVGGGGNLTDPDYNVSPVPGPGSNPGMGEERKNLLEKAYKFVVSIVMMGLVFIIFIPIFLALVLIIPLIIVYYMKDYFQ